jgi:hypothetical protein
LHGATDIIGATGRAIKICQWGVLPIRRFLLTSAWTLGLRAKINFR